MNTLVRNTILAGATFVLLGVAPQAFAQTSDNGVEPIVIPGNPTCEDILALPQFDFQLAAEVTESPLSETMGPWFVGGLEIDFIPQDPKGREFLAVGYDMAVNPFGAGVAGVIVKGGPSAHYYHNIVPALADGHLRAPDNKGVSHVTACLTKLCPADSQAELDLLCGIFGTDTVSGSNVDNSHDFNRCACSTADFEVTTEICVPGDPANRCFEPGQEPKGINQAVGVIQQFNPTCRTTCESESLSLFGTVDDSFTQTCIKECRQAK